MSDCTKFREVREQAGLSVGQAAKLLSINPVSVRRFEMNPDTTKTARMAPSLALKVLRWYRDKTPPVIE